MKLECKDPDMTEWKDLVTKVKNLSKTSVNPFDLHISVKRIAGVAQ
jgi:hypothetical protein